MSDGADIELVAPSISAAEMKAHLALIDRISDEVMSMAIGVPPRLLGILPDGPAKERAANAQSKPAPFFRLDTDQAVKAANERLVAHLAEKVERAPVLQPGDHVLLRLSPVEEQRCVLQRRSPTRDAWVLRMVRSDGTLGDETELAMRDMEGWSAAKVDPIPVKEPSAPRGRVRIKPGHTL